MPNDLREAALGLGATRMQLIRYVVLPLCLPGILTGAFLAVSRAIGETDRAGRIVFNGINPGSYTFALDPMANPAQNMTNIISPLVVLIVLT